MNKDWKQRETRLLKFRNLNIGMALIAIAGVYVFGIVAEGRDLGAWIFAVAGLIAGITALYAGREVGNHRASLAEDDHAVSPVIAVILMVAITVVLAATVFVLVADIGTNHPAPSLGFNVDSVADTLTVSSVSVNALTWGEFAVDGCTAPANETTVDAGDTLTGCHGNVKVVHKPSNTLIYQARFDEA